MKKKIQIQMETFPTEGTRLLRELNREGVCLCEVRQSGGGVEVVLRLSDTERPECRATLRTALDIFLAFGSGPMELEFDAEGTAEGDRTVAKVSPRELLARFRKNVADFKHGIRVVVPRI